MKSLPPPPGLHDPGAFGSDSTGGVQGAVGLVSEAYGCWFAQTYPDRLGEFDSLSRRDDVARDLHLRAAGQELKFTAAISYLNAIEGRLSDV